jgi:nitric oxide reductase
MTDVIAVATLFNKIPTLQLATSFEEVKYSPPRKDVGISELLVVF